MNQTTWKNDDRSKRFDGFGLQKVDNFAKYVLFEGNGSGKKLNAERKRRNGTKARKWLLKIIGDLNVCVNRNDLLIEMHR